MTVSRRPTRWLSPIAIVAVAVTGYGIARSAMGDDDEPAGKPATTRSESTRSDGARPTQTAGQQPDAPATGPVRYTVRAGDTLSSISLETGVPVAVLQELNPDVDVQALQPGQRLKLRK